MEYTNYQETEYRQINNELREHINKIGVFVHHYPAMEGGKRILFEAVAGKGSATQHELMKQLSFQPENVIMLGEALKKEGLIDVKEDPEDDWNNVLSVTEKGRGTEPETVLDDPDPECFCIFRGEEGEWIAAKLHGVAVDLGIREDALEVKDIGMRDGVIPAPFDPCRCKTIAKDLMKFIPRCGTYFFKYGNVPGAKAKCVEALQPLQTATARDFGVHFSPLGTGRMIDSLERDGYVTVVREGSRANEWQMTVTEKTHSADPASVADDPEPDYFRTMTMEDRQRLLDMLKKLEAAMPKDQMKGPNVPPHARKKMPDGPDGQRKKH